MATALESVRGMIFIEKEHPIVRDSLLEMLGKETKAESGEVLCCDFDGVSYRLFIAPNAVDTIQFRLNMPFLDALKSNGAGKIIDGLYGSNASKNKSSSGTLELSIKTNGNKESPEEIAKKFSAIKYNLMAAPFGVCFQALLDGMSRKSSPIVIPFRKEDHFILVPDSDRVMVYYSVHFTEKSDHTICRVFLQEFSELQRQIPQAPNVTFFQDPPPALNGVKGLGPSDSLVGFVQFQIFKSHLEGGKMNRTMNLLTQFHPYLVYHIKASKSHLHSRMRARCEMLIKILNRAKPKLEDPAGRSKFKGH